jgi:hypothetical protein
LSADETHLLHAASLAQTGENALVERALRTALPWASGAELGLGELFAKARLLFNRRRARVDELSPDGDNPQAVDCDLSWW